MILKTNESNLGAYLKTGFLLLGAIGILFGIWFYFPFWTAKKTDGIWLCDAETLRSTYFVSNGDIYNNGNTQSDKYAFDGKYSSKVGLGDGYQYGFGREFDDLKKGETYHASVWMKREKGTGFLVIKNKNLDFNIENPSERKNGWELLETEFSLPYDSETEPINIYTMTDGKGEIYFDQLKVEKKNTQNLTSNASFKPETINLIIKDKAWNKLKEKRSIALANGVLQQGEDDWVKGKISSATDEMIPVELRLKGDWLDHLQGNKWSFRIKVKDPYAWKQMKTFSLQTPEARDYLDEWILHQFWKKEDVLTPRYDFVEVKINGEPIGIYAWEEHFDKHLPEAQHRREGPIVRFSEEGFWENNKQMFHEYADNPYRRPNNLAATKNATIQPFKESKILASPQLLEQYKIAQNLLHQYQSGLTSPEKIFDLEKLATYYAICDALQAYHGTAWHNERFYYNPVLSKLEPIGFDGFPTYHKPRSFLGEGSLNKKKFIGEDIKDALFLNQDFLNQYIPKLFLFSDEIYLDSFYQSIQAEVDARVLFLKKEYPHYLSPIEKMRKKAIGLKTAILPINNLSIQAYQESPIELKIWNLHGLPIEIIGFGKTNKNISTYLDKPLVFKGLMTKSQDEYGSIEVAKKTNYVFYRIIGMEQVYHSKVNPWQIPQNFAPAQNILANNKFTNSSFFTIKKNNQVHFRDGQHIIQENIVIPKNYKVFFSKGTTLDFRKGAKFISYSPIEMNGTKAEPIQIISSDKSGNGFTILQADKKSRLEHVVFENLNTLNYKGWTLTGAVTFYESDVDISNCTFTKNHCEDGLNIIRSTFTLKNSEVSFTASDGFDADFCKGIVENSRFINTTNDGLDFSGSYITIINCDMNNCGDKGISVGENSNVTVQSASVKNAIIGVASKDLSTLVIENISLENCGQGFTAYQKKPEFGGSNIEVKNYEAIDVNRLYNIRSGCNLNLKGRLIEGL